MELVPQGESAEEAHTEDGAEAGTAAVREAVMAKVRQAAEAGTAAWRVGAAAKEMQMAVEAQAAMRVAALPCSRSAPPSCSPPDTDAAGSPRRSSCHIPEMTNRSHVG